jgi:hypothetical protein
MKVWIFLLFFIFFYQQIWLYTSNFDLGNLGFLKDTRISSLLFFSKSIILLPLIFQTNERKHYLYIKLRGAVL